MTSRFPSLSVNYLTIPVYVVGATSLIVQVYISDRIKRRGVFIVGCCVPVSVGYLICVGTANSAAGYVGMFVLVLGKICFIHILFAGMMTESNLRQEYIRFLRWL